MSPLDDSLHDALHARASRLAPATDPLAGIEARARGMRRRRVAASVAGAALAVSAIALAVPSLRQPAAAPSTYVTAGPTLVADGSALDLARPWTFRGALSSGARAAFTSRVQGGYPGATVTFLFGQTYEPSGQEEAVFAARTAQGDRFGWVSTTTMVDQPLDAAATALPVVLPGDEGVQRLLVVAAPDTQRIDWAGDGVVFSDITLEPQVPGDKPTSRVAGIGMTALEGTTPAARLRVIGADGSVVYEGTDGAGEERQPSQTPLGETTPANVVTWPKRGAESGTLLPAAALALAPALDTTQDQVRTRVLFTGATATGVRYVTGQAWKAGSPAAQAFSYVSPKSGEGTLFLGAETPSRPHVLAFVVGLLPAGATDLLVVVPEPTTTQVLYDDDASGPFRAVSGTAADDGVVVLERSSTPAADRLQLLTGNGDPATDVTFEGPVASLLCGAKECG